jgi:hypothetical protein
MGAPLGSDMSEGAFGVAQAPPRVLFKTQFGDAGLVWQFDRIVQGRHAFDDASEINAPFAGVQPCIARQLDHAFTGVRDAGQCVRDVKEV